MSRRLDIELEYERIWIEFPFDRKILDVVRSLPRRKFDRATKSWWAPLDMAPEVVGRLIEHNFILSEELTSFLEEQGVDPSELARDARQSHKPFIQEGLMPQGTWTVASLNNRVQEVLRDAFREEVWIASEIQGYDRNKRRGHAFFELIHRPYQGGDPNAKITAVLWQDDRERIQAILDEDGGGVRLRDGLVVRMLGRVDFYTGQGRYQMTVTDLDLAYTAGTIHQNREAVLRHLAGLDIAKQNVSKPWPLVPRRIGLITSDESDAYADFVHELARATLGFEVTLYPVSVQGSRTEASVLEALEFFAERAHKFDAVAIVRGGGARSDLAYFDTNAIGEAVCCHPLKVIVGVGHQRDVCVLDYIAHSEKTPTAAASAFVERMKAYLDRTKALEEAILELALGQVHTAKEQVRFRSEHALRVIEHALGEQAKQLDKLTFDISAKASHKVERGRRHIEHLGHQVPQGATGRLVRARAKAEFGQSRLSQSRMTRVLGTPKSALDRLAIRLERGAQQRLRDATNQSERQQEKLRLLDPRSVIGRGFALVRDQKGAVVRDASTVSQGDQVSIELAAGDLVAKVEEMKERPSDSQDPKE